MCGVGDLTYNSLALLYLLKVQAHNTSAPLCSRKWTSSANITFLTEMGDLPLLRYDATDLQGYLIISKAQQGSKEDVLCAEHGLCDETTGICQCFAGWSSSDADGNVGTRGDCGYMGTRTAYIDARG